MFLCRRTSRVAASRCAALAMKSFSTPRTSVQPNQTLMGAQMVQRRWQATHSGAAPVAPPPPPDGIVDVNIRNFQPEIQTSIPTMLYFHVTSHPEVNEFTDLLRRQISSANKEHRDQHKTDADAGCLVKLCTVDCEKERLLAEQFQINGNQFPVIYYLIDGKVADRMIGVVPEVQIRDSIHALVKYAAELRAGEQNQAKQGVGRTPIDKMDMDEENVMTLLQSGHRILKEKKDLQKAQRLFEKALAIAEPQIEKLKKDVGASIKKITPAMFEKLKKDPNYSTYPNILAGLVSCAMLQEDFDKAAVIVKRIREEFPWAIKSMRDVAHIVSRVDIIRITGFKNDDDLPGLMKAPEQLSSAVELYENRLKYIAALYFEQRHERAIEEGLKLIRAEIKMLPELKKEGYLPQDVSLSSATSTPARKVVFLIFDALGNENELVMRARKKMAAFMFA